ncbi:MAG TPA: ABC transporter permease [Stellaceae bacterium]|nr:ABC transporter permease [Stellaceae bacterium]
MADDHRGSGTAAGLREQRSLVARRGRAERRVYHLLLVPALVLLLVFYVFPVARVLWISVSEPQPGLANYAELASASVLRVLGTTVEICALTTTITVLLSYLAAYAITHSSSRLRRIMLLGVILPLWISVLVRSFAWFALLRRQGIVNAALLQLGLIHEPLALMWNALGVIIGMVHYMLPYGILPLVANMRQIDPALTAAARGLGASPLEAFRRVFLPLSLPGIVASCVLVFIFSLGFYVTPVLLGGGKVVMVTEFISNEIMVVLEWGTGTMLATALVAAVLLLLALLSRVIDVRQLFGAK